MDFRQLNSSLGDLSGVAADALLVVLHGDALAPELDATLSTLINDAIAQGDLSLKAGKTLYVHRPLGLKAARLVVSVAGGADAKAFKAAVGKGAGLIKGLGVRQMAVASGNTDALTDLHAEAIVAALHDATYLFRQTKPSAPPASTLGRVTVLCDKGVSHAVKQGLQRGQAIADGVTLARECANLPANYCTPTYLGQQAKKLGKQHGFKVEVLDRDAIKKLGMGSFLAVAQGSTEPPRFIVARYEGAAKTKAPIVLVGKGITFDTGGISIKPAAGMDEMKFDMGGAASVLGTLAAIAALKPKLNLVCLIPSCDNMPSGSAVKPGDVVTTMSGKTVEILNTDAEGRLILCDALTYAERFEPSVVVDIATLTGACVVALGHHHSGLFTADDGLAEQFAAAGRRSLDTCWRLPLDDEYDDALKSNFADMANVGGREGGAITAAMFLKRYTAKYRWVHLDIAGTAWKSGGTAKGSTGRPVPLLTHFVLSQAS